MMDNFNRFFNKDVILGLLFLTLLTYLVYGMAGGLQNRLSQNPLLIAVLFGILIGNIFTIPNFLKNAVTFSTTYFIKTGVVLIGFKISAQVIVETGYEPVLIAFSELVIILAAAYAILRYMFKFDQDLALVLAAGSAVCGAAAVMATALTVNARSSHTTLAVTLITLMGTLQLFVYPLMYEHGYMSLFNDHLFGVFAGASIYEFAQVYGAGYAVSDQAINSGTIVKLIKVLLLIPLIILFGFMFRNKQEGGKSVVKVPWFVILFALAVALNSLFTINGTVKVVISDVGAFLFLLAMVALGMKTDIRAIVKEHSPWKILGSTSLIIILTTVITYLLIAFIMVKPGAAITQKASLVTGDLQREAHYVPSHTGELVFNRIGCDKCHVRALPTKNGDELVLYSDLLIHDMGFELDDKIVQGDAIGTDWRTAPLAGIASRDRFLHDGRATNYRDAIIAHGGEAQIIRDRFVDLSSANQRELLNFLDTLK